MIYCVRNGRTGPERGWEWVYSGLFVSTQVIGVPKPVWMACEMLLSLQSFNLSLRWSSCRSAWKHVGLQSRGVAVLDHRWKDGPERSMYS